MFNFFAFLMIMCVIAALFSMVQMLMAVSVLKKLRDEKIALSLAKVQVIEDSNSKTGS